MNRTFCWLIIVKRYMILLNKYINGRVPYVQEIKNIFLCGPILKSLLSLFHQKVSKSWNNLIEQFSQQTSFMRILWNLRTFKASIWSLGDEFKWSSYKFKGLPWGHSGKESTCQCKRCGFDPWVGKIPWRRKWQTTPVFLTGESHGQRSLVDHSSWIHEVEMSWTRLNG